jgi:hypothetical protein
LNVLGVITILAFLAIFVVETNYYYKKGSEILACKNPIFVTSEAIAVLLSVIFVYLGKQITKNV